MLYIVRYSKINIIIVVSTCTWYIQQKINTSFKLIRMLYFDTSSILSLKSLVKNYKM